MTRSAWDPAQYRKFTADRHRPALELLARIDHPDPGRIHDVGCGTGEITKIMAERWPQATVVGSDSSPEMLAQATLTSSEVEWRQGDVCDWAEPPELDVIYSNAVLHWVPDHDELILRLLHSLQPEGQLAIQMPMSWHEPSHVLMRRTLPAEALGSDASHATHERPNVADPEHYGELLLDLASSVDIWVTRYYQQLTGPNAVLEWVSGTALRPILAELTNVERSQFLTSYSDALREAYPEVRPGLTMFPFPRLFIVATR